MEALLKKILNSEKFISFFQNKNNFIFFPIIICPFGYLFYKSINLYQNFLKEIIRERIFIIMAIILGIVLNEEKLSLYLYISFGIYVYTFFLKYSDRNYGLVSINITIIFFISIIIKQKQNNNLVLIFGGLFFLLMIYEIVKLSSKFNNESKEELGELLKQREQKLFELIEKIENPKISSILIDSKIGTGKSFLMEHLIFKNENKYEIIYLKLPFFENLELFKKIMLKEINKILKKNGISVSIIDDLLKTVSNISTFNEKLAFKYLKEEKSFWENCCLLKDIFKNKIKKKVLLIFDDLERVDDEDKVLQRKMLLFLGEFSEFFKYTNVTTIILADNTKLKEYFENEKEHFIEKYFKDNLVIGEIKFDDLEEEDFKKLNSNLNNQVIKSILLLIKNLKNYLTFEKNIEIDILNEYENNNNIRNIEKFLNNVEQSQKYKEYYYFVLVIFIEKFLPSYYNELKKILKIDNVKIENEIINYDKSFIFYFIKNEEIFLLTEFDKIENYYKKMIYKSYNFYTKKNIIKEIKIELLIEKLINIFNFKVGKIYNTIPKVEKKIKNKENLDIEELKKSIFYQFEDEEKFYIAKKILENIEELKIEEIMIYILYSIPKLKKSILENEIEAGEVSNYILSELHQELESIILSNGYISIQFKINIDGFKGLIDEYKKYYFNFFVLKEKIKAKEYLKNENILLDKILEGIKIIFKVIVDTFFNQNIQVDKIETIKGFLSEKNPVENDYKSLVDFLFNQIQNEASKIK